MRHRPPPARPMCGPASVAPPGVPAAAPGGRSGGDPSVGSPAVPAVLPHAGADGNGGGGAPRRGSGDVAAVNPPAMVPAARGCFARRGDALCRRRVSGGSTAGVLLSHPVDVFVTCGGGRRGNAPQGRGADGRSAAGVISRHVGEFGVVAAGVTGDAPSARVAAEVPQSGAVCVELGAAIGGLAAFARSPRPSWGGMVGPRGDRACGTGGGGASRRPTCGHGASGAAVGCGGVDSHRAGWRRGGARRGGALLVDRGRARRRRPRRPRRRYGRRRRRRVRPRETLWLVLTHGRGALIRFSLLLVLTKEGWGGGRGRGGPRCHTSPIPSPVPLRLCRWCFRLRCLAPTAAYAAAVTKDRPAAARRGGWGGTEGTAKSANHPPPPKKTKQKRVTLIAAVSGGGPWPRGDNGSDGASTEAVTRVERFSCGPDGKARRGRRVGCGGDTANRLATGTTVGDEGGGAGSTRRSDAPTRPPARCSLPLSVPSTARPVD